MAGGAYSRKGTGQWSTHMIIQKVMTKYGPLTERGIIFRLKQEGYRNVPTRQQLVPLLGMFYRRVGVARRYVGGRYNEVFVWHLPPPRRTIVVEKG